MTDDRLAKLEWQVEALTKVVAALTESKIVYNGLRQVKQDINTISDLGLRGPAQARMLMDELGLPVD